MTVSLEDKSNPHIHEVYGPILERAFAEIADMEMSDFEPAAGTVVVKRAPPETMTKGGLHLPNVAQKDQNIGVVVAVNCDADCPWKVEDVVMFRGEGYKVTLGEGDEYTILQYRGCIDDEIIGKFVSKKVVDGN